MNAESIELLSELIKKQVHDLNASLKVAAEDGVLAEIDIIEDQVIGREVPRKMITARLLKVI